MLIRTHDADERIIYGTGQTIEMKSIFKVLSLLFENSDIAFLHVRSPTNNCYHFRIDKQ